MTTDLRCPDCGGASAPQGQSGRRRCEACGASLAWRPRWLPLLATAIAFSALLGAGGALLFGGKAAFLVAPLTVPAILIMSRRLRRLRKA